MLSECPDSQVEDFVQTKLRIASKQTGQVCIILTPCTLSHFLLLFAFSNRMYCFSYAVVNCHFVFNQMLCFQVMIQPLASKPSLRVAELDWSSFSATSAHHLISVVPFWSITQELACAKATLNLVIHPSRL